MYLEILTLYQMLNFPQHAYEIRTNINNMIIYNLNINNNTLYPLMKRIEKEGYATRELKAQSGRPNKFIYHITDAGRKRFLELLRTFSEKDAVDDMEFFTRVVFLKYLQKNEIQKIIKMREEYLIKKQHFYNKFNDQKHDIYSNLNYGDIKMHLNEVLNLELEYIKTLEETLENN